MCACILCSLHMDLNLKKRTINNRDHLESINPTYSNVYNCE